MKYKLFTHTDLDGVGCAILAYLAFGRENVDVEYCNYNDVNEKVSDFLIYGAPGEYNAVFITDISISEELAKTINKYTVDDLWCLFDHYNTAESLNRFSWCHVLDTIPLSNGVKTSGTELFYTYLRSQNTFLDEFPGRVQQNIKRFVTVVRNYDTWRWKELGEKGGCLQAGKRSLLYLWKRCFCIMG